MGRISKNLINKKVRLLAVGEKCNLSMNGLIGTVYSVNDLGNNIDVKICTSTTKEGRVYIGRIIYFTISDQLWSYQLIGNDWDE